MTVRAAGWRRGGEERRGWEWEDDGDGYDEDDEEEEVGAAQCLAYLFESQTGQYRGGKKQPQK